MNRYSTLSAAVLALALAAPVFAQIPEDVAKSSADLAARQAEAIARAQQKVAEDAQRQREEREREAEAKRNAVVPLDVQVNVSRYQGDKRVSSFPYQLSVNAVHAKAVVQITNLRMGAQVPLPTMATPTVDGKPVTGMLTTNPVQYKEIGTHIDAWANFLDGGTFDVGVTVDDTSVYIPRSDAQSSPIDALPVLRTFRSSNHMVLKDGQTKQFTLAADRVSGETLRVEVTLKVAK